MTRKRWNEIFRVAIDDMINLPIQINGKLKATVKVNKDSTQEEVDSAVENNDIIKNLISEKEIIKKIYVKGKIYNIVIK